MRRRRQPAFLIRCKQMHQFGQSPIDSIRQYVATAAGGISIGAALTIILPIDLLRIVGLEHSDATIAVKMAVIGMVVSIVARRTRIIIRRK